MSELPWLDKHTDFPNPSAALSEPNGLLAASSELCTEQILLAYRSGIFPWYSEEQPVLWWSPDPRCIIYPNQVHISRSLKKHNKQHQPRLTFDSHFAQVIRHCARLDSEEGTWITAEMEEAYIALHEAGYAHSVEVWENNTLIGGLYGIAMGQCFFGESMFSLAPNASKIAFAYLCRQLEKWNYQIIDCQVDNPHLRTLGAITIPRKTFLEQLERSVNKPARKHEWTFDISDLK
ncbi:MAG: leucyl/phenylalanyl-tRNA--protein transferase [Oleiphilus sp.]